MLTIALSIAASALLMSCGRDSGSEKKFNSTLLINPQFGHSLHMRDHHGQWRTLADYRGKLVLLFFGYTQCPDICPTTMARAKHALRILGEDANRVQVLFVTLDPQHDTRELLSQYIPSFHDDFIGLYASPAETLAIANSFKVYYQRVAGKSAQSYVIDHSVFSYVYDSQGKLTLLVNHDLTAKELAEDLRTLLQKKKADS